MIVLLMLIKEFKLLDPPKNFKKCWSNRLFDFFYSVNLFLNLKDKIIGNITPYE
jgi:hypothetical protein